MARRNYARRFHGGPGRNRICRILHLHQTAPATALRLWSAVFSACRFVVAGRGASFCLDGASGRCCAADATLAIFAGCLDVTGTALFIRANQTGRLDSAVVLSLALPGD